MISRHPLPARHRFASKLLKVRDLTPTVKEFIFSTPPEFNFYAGQFVTLRFQVENRTVGRPYSIASPPQLKEKVELCIKLVDGGLVTPMMFYQPKKEMDVSGPMGRFFLHPEHKDRDLVFIGTGTGIAPLKSMIQDLYHHGFNRKLTVLAGVRYVKEILYTDLWTDLSNKHSHFQFSQMVSRPEVDEDSIPFPFPFHKGRVGDLLPEFVDGDQVFVICGLKEMINTVTGILKSKGVREDRILYEKYD